MKEKKTSYKSYVCEVCGRESSHKSVIAECENQHKCPHEQVEYVFTEACDEWPHGIKGVEKRCTLCLHTLGEVELDDVEGNKEIMSKIYDLVRSEL